MAEIGIQNTTGAIDESIVIPAQNTGARRKLQLFRNKNIATDAEAAKAAIDNQALLDGEVIIARYGDGDKGVLGIKTKVGVKDEIIYFDSAALSDALQSVSGGTGISVTDKANNNQVISLDIANAELSNGVITVKEKTPAEGIDAQTIFTISGVTADNVTYTGATSGLTSGSTTVDAAIEKLDDELIKANKANLTGATVAASDDKATVTFKNSNDVTLSEFSLESNDDNLTVTADGATGITLGIKSVAGDENAEPGTGAEGSDEGDVLTQKSYVDAEIAKAKKTAAVTVESNKSDDEGATLVEFKKVGTEADAEKYYVNMTVGEGSDATVYNIELDAKNFVRDGVIFNGEVVYIPSTGVTDLTAATDATAIPEGASKSKTGDATQAAILLRVKNAVDPDATQTYSTITIKTSDLLGDLVGGDGIDFDGSKIAIDLATPSGFVKLSLDGDTPGSKKLNVTATTGTVTYTETPAEGAKKFSDSDTTGLATSANLAEVANDLQVQIDLINGKQNSGSTAITITTGTTGDVIALKLDDSTAEDDTIGGKAVGQYVGTTSNALAITADGLYLSNVWDCGEF